MNNVSCSWTERIFIPAVITDQKTGESDKNDRCYLKKTPARIIMIHGHSHICSPFVTHTPRAVMNISNSFVIDLAFSVRVFKNIYICGNGVSYKAILLTSVLVRCFIIVSLN